MAEVDRRRSANIQPVEVGALTRVSPGTTSSRKSVVLALASSSDCESCLFPCDRELYLGAEVRCACLGWRVGFGSFHDLLLAYVPSSILTEIQRAEVRLLWSRCSRCRHLLRLRCSPGEGGYHAGMGSSQLYEWYSFHADQSYRNSPTLEIASSTRLLPRTTYVSSRFFVATVC